MHHDSIFGNQYDTKMDFLDKIKDAWALWDLKEKKSEFWAPHEDRKENEIVSIPVLESTKIEETKKDSKQVAK